MKINYSGTVLAWLVATLLFTACGGGGVSPPAGGGTTSYTAGGSTSGLIGSVVLQDNGGNNLTVSTNGSFTFANQLPSGSTYNVIVLTQPTGQTCTVSSGAGTISGSNVTNVSVVCSSLTYSLGGSVTGLTGSVVLQDNNGDNLSVAANGAFTFATQVASGSFYSVTIFTQPAGQICSVTNGTGTITVTNVASVAVNCGTSSLALFAGKLSGPGSADGTGAAASFYNPNGVATDSADNIYVADTSSNTIRKITPAGVVSTLAGSVGVTGHADGTGAAASFNFPMGVAIDSANNIYVADSGNNTVRKITPAGVVTTLAGTAGVTGSADGAGAAASFNHLEGVARDSTDNIYVSDSSNYTIRKITPAGVVSTLAGTAGVAGSADGTGAAARFGYPEHVATDSADNIYVADTSNNTIRKITPTGVVTTLAGTAGVTGNADGTGPAASFKYSQGVATDSAGNVYVADTSNNTIRKITPAGVVTTLAGTAGVTGSADGTGAAASFNYPMGVATDSTGNVYVADRLNYTVRRITPAGVVSTLAGTAGITGSADGAGAVASFNHLEGVATDSTGNVYVADSSNYTVRKITSAGVVSTLAGTAGVAGNADGAGAAARFNFPAGVAIDSTGNVYVTDHNNYTIRKITPTGVVSTLAGLVAVIGHADGIGTAAKFYNPTGIATDSADNIYVADSGNNTIRKITPTGVVSTLAGTAGVTGHSDGTGVAASFYNPTSVATDSTGNVYVADSGNSTIRKITPAGVVSTVVGVVGQIGFTAGALPGVLFHPSGVAFSGGSLYIATQNGIAVVTYVP